jgi:hypothetical protein
VQAELKPAALAFWRVGFGRLGFHRRIISDRGQRGQGNLDFAEGPWCWLLANVRRVTPIPWRGRQKLFDVPWPR